MRWPQCWIGERSIKLCLHHSWSGRGGGMGGEGVLISHCLSFSTKISHPALFSSLSPIHFFFRKYTIYKSLIVAKAKKCKMYIGPFDWYFELYLSVMKRRENRRGRSEEGEERGGFLPTLFPSPDLDSLPLGLWTTGAVVFDRKNRELTKLWLSESREQSWDHFTVRHILSFK